MVEALLWRDLQTFIERTDAVAQERNDILAGLKIPDKALERLHELCLLPGVLFLYCCGEHWERLHREARKEIRRLRSRLRHVHQYPLLSDTLKERTCQEVEVLIKVLEGKYPSMVQLDAWRKQLGIDKRLNLAPQKQRIWSDIFKELVTLLRPYCSGPKCDGSLDSPASPIPEEAFRIASRLVHLA
jgi:hypothetical protein